PEAQWMRRHAIVSSSLQASSSPSSSGTLVILRGAGGAGAGTAVGWTAAGSGWASAGGATGAGWIGASRGPGVQGRPCHGRPSGHVACEKTSRSGDGGTQAATTIKIEGQTRSIRGSYAWHGRAL